MYFTAIIFLTIFLPIPVMHREIRKGSGPYRAVLEGVIAVGIATMLVFIFSMAAGEPVGQMMAEAGSEAVKSLLGDSSLLHSLGLSQLTSAEQESFLSALYLQSSQIIPSMILILASIISYFEYMFISSVACKAGAQVRKLPKFREFSMPRHAIFGWCLMLGLTYLINLTSLVADNILLANMEMLFVFAFSVQGLSTIFTFFYAKRLPTVIAVIAAIFILGTSIGQIVALFLGLLDLTFDCKGRLLLNTNKR